MASIETASTWILFGTITVGSVVSITEMVWVADAELPEVSVAVHVTRVSPSGNTSGASLVIEETSTKSDTLASPKSIIFSTKLLASTRRSEGAVMWGKLVSMTVTICWSDIEFS